ncbi:MAG: transcriptional regulator, partial [Acidobacteria bacterium]|nr:transcriptional regulator [Acidobacteriota bacterium]
MVSMGMPEVAIDGEVVESDPPRKLVQTYRFLFNETTKSEGFTRLTWEIE